MSVKEQQRQVHGITGDSKSPVCLPGLALSLLLEEVVGIMPLSRSNPCTGFPVLAEKSSRPYVVQQTLWTCPGVLCPHDWLIPVCWT